MGGYEGVWVGEGMGVWVEGVWVRAAISGVAWISQNCEACQWWDSVGNGRGMRQERGEGVPGSAWEGRVGGRGGV